MSPPITNIHISETEVSRFNVQLKVQSYQVHKHL